MSERVISVYGTASKKEWQLTVKRHHLHLSLMDFLILNKFPIASSCRGEGSCRKCVYDENELSCQIKMKTLLESKNLKVSFGYL